ncbi:MAG: ribonuclease E/G, partial [Pseudomonadota bacterium]
MPNRMLIDASHPEETRVVVAKDNRLADFDFESEHKSQIRGNIYLAKVTRVEPSLQAAFVDFGGNRHGFLAFSEIHPDYYQIPLADRQALLAEEEAYANVEADEEDEQVENLRKGRKRRRRRGGRGRNGNSDDKRASEGAVPDAELVAMDDILAAHASDTPEGDDDDDKARVMAADAANDDDAAVVSEDMDTDAPHPAAANDDDGADSDDDH